MASDDPAQRRQIRILLADDDDTIVTIVQTALRLDGFEVVRTHDGEEALRFGREQEFDLVLLDVEMPLLDGFAVCRELRADPRLAALPILMLTAQRDREGLLTGFAQGATDYLVKPFEVAQLRARVRTWLERSARWQAPDPPRPSD
jgi:DNA-binding response OmpR family regulator